MVKRVNSARSSDQRKENITYFNVTKGVEAQLTKLGFSLLFLFWAGLQFHDANQNAGSCCTQGNQLNFQA